MLDIIRALIYTDKDAIDTLRAFHAAVEVAELAAMPPPAAQRLLMRYAIVYATPAIMPPLFSLIRRCRYA